MKKLAFAAAALAALILPAASAQAANGSWTAPAGGDWVTPGNWLDSIVPGATGTTDNADVATFGTSGGSGTVTVDAGRNVFGITFGTHNYVLSGGGLVLSAGGNITGSTGSLVVESNVTLQGAATFTGSGTGGGITISGTVAGTAGEAINQVLTLTGTSADNLVSGSITDGAGGGTVSVTKTGTGTWELSTANTYSGGTIIANNGGNLLVTHAEGLGTGNVNIQTMSGSSSGALQLAGNIVLTGPAQILLSSNSPIAQIENVSGNNSYAGTIHSTSTVMRIASTSGKLTLSGTISNDNNSGGTGTVKNLVLSGAGDGELGGKITKSANLTRPMGLIFSGTGTWILSNPGTGTDRNNYAAATQINAGTVLINTDNTLATGVVTVADGATLGGNGIVGGATTVRSGGTLAAGNSADILTFNADVLHETGSFFEWELFANTTADRGASFDGIDFTGTRTLTIQDGVTAELVFDGVGSTVDWTDSFWDSDQSWLVFSGASSSDFGAGGIFSAITAGQDSLDQDFSITGGSFSFSSVGNDVYLNYAIPEPSAFVLAALGTAFLGLRRRKA